MPGPALLGRPPLRWAPLLVGLILAAVTVRIGFYSDDWPQIARLEGAPGFPPPQWDVYRFADGVAEHVRANVVAGPLPWFSAPDLKLAFFRPLSSLIFALDLKVFGHAPLGWHLHAIAWHLAAIALAAALFRRILPGAPATADLAALIFAVDAAHMEPVGWIACRHVLFTAVPAMAALLLHVRWRAGNLPIGRALAPLAFAIALGGGEVSLGTLALLGAFELLGPPRERRDPLRARLLALAPYAALLVVYVALYKAFGCGAAGGGGYVDPSHDLGRYAITALDRFPILVSTLAWQLPAELSNLIPHAPFYVAAALGVIAFGGFARSRWSALAPEEQTAIRWLVPGALVAVAMSLGGYPGGRVLMLPSLAGSMFFAILVTRAGQSIAARAGRIAIVVIHLVAAPLLFVGEANATAEMARKMLDVAVTVDLGPNPENEQVVVLAGSDPFASFYPGALRYANHLPTARAWQVISMAKTTHRITRVSDHVIRLRFLDNPMMAGSFEQVFRAREPGFRAGDRVELEGAVVRVIEVDGAQPREIELRFDRAIGDPALRLLVFRDGKLGPMPALADGASLEVPWSPGPTGLF